MVQTVTKSAANTINLTIPIGLMPVVTCHQFAALAAANRDLRLELTAKGELIVMPPTGGETGRSNSELTRQMGNWADQHSDLGLVFDSSTGFTLPSGAIRSPDASWVKRDRWESLSEGDRQSFPPLCPDVVVELRSRSDSLSETQAKMNEYIENGATFGLLIDPRRRMVEIYHPEVAVEVIEDPSKVSFSEVMPGFELSLKNLL